MPDLSATPLEDMALLEAELPDALNETLREIAISNYLELLDDAEVVAALGKPRIAELAVALTNRVSQEVGGRSFYMPKGISARLSPRDREIGERYNGRNLRELAREYGISDVRVMQIHKKWRAAEIARRQGVLTLA